MYKISKLRERWEIKLATKNRKQEITANNQTNLIEKNSKVD